MKPALSPIIESMNFFPYSARRVKASFAVLWLLCCTAAQAGNAAAPSSGWPARFPSGSIQSIETAETALGEADTERARIQERFAAEEQGCFDLFVANACRDAAGERRRVALSAVRTVEIEANAFKRLARAAEREKRSAEKRVLPDASDKRESNADGGLVEAAIPPPDAFGRVSTGAIGGGMEGAHPVRRQTANPGERKPAAAEDRSDRIAAYERKVREAEAHQRKVALRKAEREKKRRSKAPQ